MCAFKFNITLFNSEGKVMTLLEYKKKRRLTKTGIPYKQRGYVIVTVCNTASLPPNLELKNNHVETK